MSKLVELKRDQLAARKEYMKERTSESQVKSSLLTTLIGEVESRAKGDGVEVTDESVIATIKKFIKGLEEALKLDPSSCAYVEAVAEKAILESYLPLQMSEGELTTIVEDLVNQVGATGVQDMGKVMGALKSSYDGRYDGGTASKIVKRVLMS